MAIPIIQRTKESAIAVKDSEKLERIATGIGVISRAVEFASDRQQKENKFIRDQWMMSKSLATSQMNLTKKEMQRFQDAQRKEADKDLQEKEDKREQKGLFEKIANYLLQQNKDKVSDKNLAKAKKGGFLKWLFITFGIADLATIIYDTIARVKRGVDIFKAIFQSIGKVFAKPIAWVKNTRLWKGLTGFFSSIGNFFVNQKKKVLNGKWVQSIKNFFSGIGNLLRGIGDSIKKSKAFNVLKGLFAPQGPLGFIGNIFRKLNAAVDAKGGIGKTFKGILDFIMKWTKRLRWLFKPFRTIAALLFKFLGWPITLIMGLIGGIKGFIKGFNEDGILGGIKGAIWGAFDMIVGSFVNSLSWLGGWILEKLGFEELGKKMQKFDYTDFMKKAFSLVIELITWPFNKISGFFKGAYDYVVGLFGGGEGKGEEKEGGKGILPKIADMFSFVGQIISWPFNKISGFWKGAYDYVVGLFGGGEGEKTEEKKGILPSFSDMFKSVLDIFTTIPKKIGDFFSRGMDWITEKVKEFDIIGMIYDFIDNSDLPEVGKKGLRTVLSGVGFKDPREARRKEETALKKSMAEQNEKNIDNLERAFMNSERMKLRRAGFDRKDIETNLKRRKESGQFRKQAEDRLRKSGQLVEYQDPKTLMERMEKLGRGLKASGATQEDADRFSRMSNALKSTDLEKRRAGLQEMKKLEAEMKTRQEKRSAPVIVSPSSKNTVSHVDGSVTVNSGGTNHDSLKSMQRAYASPALSAG